MGRVDLDTAWQRALSLAWDGFCARTTQVGAVVANENGQIVAQGQNRRQPAATERQLSHCHIAHAQINALARPPPDRRYEGHTLVMTLEPCCMCTGAIAQTAIRRVHFAGRDPYAGATRMPIGTPQALRRPLQVTGPVPDHYGWLAELLHLLWLLHHNALAPVLDAQRRGVPDAYAAAAAQSIRDPFARWHGTGPP
jgi:tRNA(adenine34) deaminase